MEAEGTPKLEPIIPGHLVIGVTGHRKLENEPALAEQVRRTLERMKGLIPPLQRTPLALTVLSAVAEGADRLVACEVLKTPDAQLEVVLPLEKDDYLHDFHRPESRKEFEELCARARRVRELPPKPIRDEAYLQGGRYVVDNCDVLLALWNGKPAAGQGGTAEIVHYAQQKKCPLFWIHTDGPTQITYEPGTGISPRRFQDLDQYNAERIGISEIEEHKKNEYQRLREHAARAGFPGGELNAVCEQLLPHYVRADRLALKYQHRYFGAGSLVYALAAAAVVVVAFQALLVPKWPEIVILEVAFMVAVLAIPWLGNRQCWHTKWIDYRFLAERFRSALFMVLTNVDVSTLRPPRHLSLAYSSNDWMVMAFSSVWSQLPRARDLAAFKALRELLSTAWIEDQIGYHKGTSERHHRRHHRMALASNVLFALTFVAALLHVFHVGTDIVHRLFALLGIALPAIAGALAAIRTHREYLRNAKRSSEMQHHLEELKGQMMAAESFESFQPLVREAEETMLHENEDWRVAVRFHILETPV